MTEREKIISLARECSKPKPNPHTTDCYHNEYFTLDAEELETFYHASIADFLKSSGQYLTNDASRKACVKQVKSEAFEAAAQVAESTVWKQHHKFNDGEPFKDHMHWEDIAAAIREMAKEQS